MATATPVTSPYRHTLSLPDALPFPRSDLGELPAGLVRKLVAQRCHLALAQLVDQPGREADAARLPLGEALANEMFGPPVHRVANFRAEAATTERDGIAGDRLPVEPGRAGRVDLPLDV